MSQVSFSSRCTSTNSTTISFKVFNCLTNSAHLLSAGPSHSVDEGDVEEDSEEEEEEGGTKRRRSDSYSLTFDDSLSWCVIGGLGSGRERHSSQSSDSHSTVSMTHNQWFIEPVLVYNV